MIKFTVLIVMAIFMAGNAFADDPGERDSIIVETVFAELGDSTVDVRIYATSDDSVMYYNFPITWSAFNDSSIHFTGVTYHNTLLYWDATYDSLLLDQEFLRMLGWSDGNFLNTYNYRLHCWTLHFAIDSMALPQVVFIDTTQDPVNGSLLFGLAGGAIGFAPEFIPGAIYYGITSDNSENELILPSEIMLSQNYPNPFNASTTIKYSLSVPSDVTIEIYDLLGRKVETLVDQIKQAGQHQVVWDALNHSSGVYFYRLQAGDAVETKRMVLLK